MTPDYTPFAPDVSVLCNDLSEARGLPLLAFARNEARLLPDFLDHYRALGVERFFILDDQSTDGSRDFLRRQGDVCLLGSTRRYGDKPDPQSLAPPLRKKTDLRLIHQWRTALMNRFCNGQWAVQCDVDEFLLLPDGQRLQDIAVQLDREGAQGLWGGMIDLYPASINDLDSYPRERFTYPRQTWYFDAVRHFSLRAGKPPLHHYVGVRHRLDVAYGGKPDLKAWARIKLRLFGRRKAPSGTLVKPVFQRWQVGAYYLDSHRTTLPLSNKRLMPLLHYRYTPAMLDKLKWATTDGGYSKGNADYVRIEKMLAEMKQRDASFLTSASRRVDGFDVFVRSGNAIL